MTVVADAFDELQQRLGEALHANRAGSGIDHVMILLPSFPAYAPLLAEHAASIGEQLARDGAIGRFSVDFVAAADDG